MAAAVDALEDGGHAAALGAACLIGVHGMARLWSSVREEPEQLASCTAATAVALGGVGVFFAALGAPGLLVFVLAAAGAINLLILAFQATSTGSEEELVDWDEAFPDARESEQAAAGEPETQTPTAKKPPPATRVPRTREQVSPAVAALYEGKRCDICGEAVRPGEAYIECLSCHRWYHEDCWERVGHCVTPDCPDAPQATVAPAAVAASHPGQGADKVGECPYCQTPIVAGEEMVICPQCKTPHHAECWRDNRGCAVYGCAGRVRE